MTKIVNFKVFYFCQVVFFGGVGSVGGILFSTLAFDKYEEDKTNRSGFHPTSTLGGEWTLIKTFD